MEVFKKYKKVWAFFIIIMLGASIGITFMVKGIMKAAKNSNSFVEMGSVEYNVGNKWNKKYSYFNGTDSKSIKLKQGEVINIEYSSEIKEGSLKILFEDENDEVITNLLDDSSGKYQYKTENDGSYKIKVVGEKTKGQFNLKWDISK